MNDRFCDGFLPAVRGYAGLTRVLRRKEWHEPTHGVIEGERYLHVDNHPP
jgi:hypothetical protein